jgi:hypothetical protein
LAGAGTAQGTTVEVDRLEVYQFTDAGVALSATVAGTKYYKDKKLH